MRHLFSCGRADIVFRQAGIGALAFDADDLHQPAIGGELHELLMTLVGGQARRNRRKAARPGSLVKNTDNWHPKKGGGRREPPRPKALCKKFRQVAQAAVAPDDSASRRSPRGPAKPERASDAS